MGTKYNCQVLFKRSAKAFWTTSPALNTEGGKLKKDKTDYLPCTEPEGDRQHNFLK